MSKTILLLLIIFSNSILSMHNYDDDLPPPYPGVVPVIKHKIKINNKSSKKLLIAIKNRQVHDMRKALNNHADPNIRDDQTNDTALMKATRSGLIELVGVLLEHGANINLPSQTGSSPLHIAAQYGFSNIAELLISAGASIDQKRNDGITALMLASRHEHMPMVEILITAGASIDKAVLQIAVDSNNILLLRTLMSVDDYEYDQSLLYRALGKRHWAILFYLATGF